jgi:hypothetical protein
VSYSSSSRKPRPLPAVEIACDEESSCRALIDLILRPTPSMKWSKTQSKQAFIQECGLQGRLKSEAWEDAQSRGMPKAVSKHDHLLLNFEAFPEVIHSGQMALRQEALRGGALGPGFEPLWAAAFLAPRRFFDRSLWDGMDPLTWAFEHGMKPSQWSAQTILRCPIPRLPQGLADVAGFLNVLQKAGARLESPHGAPTDSKGRGLVERLLMCSAPREAFVALSRMGCPPWERAAGEAPALRRALAARTPETCSHLFAALTQAAHAAGSLSRLLDQRDEDGRGPMHWAAQHLRVQEVDLLAARGADPNERDHRGDAPGHLALSTRGPSQHAAQTLCVEALDRAGFDWNSTDSRGLLPIEKAAGGASKQALSVLLEAAPECFLNSALAAKLMGARGAWGRSESEKSTLKMESPAALSRDKKGPGRL